MLGCNAPPTAGEGWVQETPASLHVGAGNPETCSTLSEFPSGIKLWLFTGVMGWTTWSLLVFFSFPSHFCIPSRAPLESSHKLVLFHKVEARSLLHGGAQTKARTESRSWWWQAWVCWGECDLGQRGEGDHWIQDI